MATGGGTGTSRSIQETPTWALATVCFIFIFFGLFIEHLVHLLSQWLKKHRKRALLEAIEKLKSVLMLLGFMSLILTVTQRFISKICIANKFANTMLPCRKRASTTKTTKSYQNLLLLEENAIFHIISQNNNNNSHPERQLAAASSSSFDYCGSKGKTSLISQKGLNELNIFIFVLAIMQILYSVFIMALGRAKMKHWNSWEKETQTVEYLAANDPNRFRFTRQTTFAKRHTSAGTSSLILWIKCFFRQFFSSLAKVDYLTLRHGFISAHLPTNNSFDFGKYIQRSLEDDFKNVVGISPYMWLVVVILLLLDVQGWHVYLWMSFVPLIVVLVVGTKLEVILAKMAIEVKNQNSVIKGTPLVQPNDNLFWFGKPTFVLTLLHFILFTNAFELAFFIWVTIQFGIKSCYHERVEIIVIRVVLTVSVQVLCGYITLPLYALVTQMGSQFKSAVLEEETAHFIKQWHREVKAKRKKMPLNSQSPRGNSSPGTTLTNVTLENARNWSSLTNNNNDISSSHLRSPTTGQFGSGTNEITEEENTHQRVVLPIEPGTDKVQPVEQ